jgi:Flp pilus assembly protein TadB
MFFDKNTHIINTAKPLGFEESPVQDALDYYEDYGNDKTYQWLVKEKKMDAAKAAELITLFKKELKKAYRERILGQSVFLLLWLFMAFVFFYNRLLINGFVAFFLVLFIIQFIRMIFNFRRLFR